MFESINNVNQQVKIADNRRPVKIAMQPLSISNEVHNQEDLVTLGREPMAVVTYDAPANKAEAVDCAFTSLRELLARVLEKQGVAARVASGDTSIDFRELSPAQAEELIAEDGYLGVEQTSDRIVRFAISMAGNDPGKLEEIKASINKGFQLASKALGGYLLEISLKTHAAIMEKLDAWAENPEVSH